MSQYFFEEVDNVTVENHTKIVDIMMTMKDNRHYLFRKLKETRKEVDFKDMKRDRDQEINIATKDKNIKKYEVSEEFYQRWEREVKMSTMANQIAIKTHYDANQEFKKGRILSYELDDKKKRYTNKGIKRLLEDLDLK